MTKWIVEKCSKEPFAYLYDAKRDITVCALKVKMNPNWKIIQKLLHKHQGKTLKQIGQITAPILK